MSERRRSGRGGKGGQRGGKGGAGGAARGERGGGGGARGGGSHGRRQRIPYYAVHWSQKDVKEGLRNHTLVEGALKILAKNRNKAFVRVAGLPVDVFVEGDKLRNRALDGDRVAVQLQPHAQWTPRDSTAAAVAELAAAPAAPPTPPDAALIAAVGAAEASGGVVVAGGGGGPAAGDGAGTGTGDDERLSERLWRSAAVEAVLGEGAAGGAGAAAADEDDESDDCSAVEFLDAPADVQAAVRRGELQPRGRVVAILEQVHSRIAVGVLRPMMDDHPAGAPIPPRASFVSVHPLDKRVPYVLIPRAEAPAEFLTDPSAYGRMLREVAITGWEAGSRFPIGTLRAEFGLAGTVAAETAALLYEHGISDADFSDAVKACLPIEVQEKRPWKIPEEEIAKRRDLRDYRIFSIDPFSARDLDDALHVKDMGGGLYEVGVHIADVSYFVRPGTALDEEAARRCTSTYLIQKVIPMLPRPLCEDLCSLNPNEDRLAFSCIWTMHDNGAMAEGPAWFGRTIIRSCAKLDYGLAQRFIDGDITEDRARDPAAVTEEEWPADRRPTGGHTLVDVIRDVLALQTVASSRRRARFASGALALHSVQLSFNLGPEPNLVPVEPPTSYPIRDSNRLIEEYMLMANYLVAQEIALKTGSRAVLRNHPPPDEKGIKEFRDTCAAIGIEVDISSAAGLHASLERVRRSFAGESGRTLVGVLEQLAIGAMNRAMYFAVGDKPMSEWRHYALGIPYYTHFTSPIRRYADVMVHRLLQATLEGGGEIEAMGAALEALPSAAELGRAAEQCNQQKEAADNAQQDSSRVFLAIYLDANPTVVDGVVSDMGEKSFKVTIPAWGLEQQIFLDKCGLAGRLDSAGRSRRLHLRPLNGDEPDPASPGALRVDMFTPVRVRLEGDLKVVPVAIQAKLVSIDARGADTVDIAAWLGARR